MALEDLTKDQLLTLASEHSVEGRSSMTKDQLVSALEEVGVLGPTAQTAGFQQGAAYPKVPVTPDDFAQLLRNPDLPAENQAAPSPEMLNPHLFPDRIQ